MTISSYQSILAAISGAGRRFPDVLKHGKGEPEEVFAARVKEKLRKSLGKDWGFDEVVLDGTNRFRNGVARAVLKALSKLGNNNMDEAWFERFLNTAAEALSAELRPYLNLAVGMEAKDVVVALDGVKESIDLLKKGREKDPLGKHDRNKIDAFMQKCAQMSKKSGQQSAKETKGEAMGAVLALVAGLLHDADTGHALTELIWERAIKTLQSEYSGIGIHLCVCREADMMCLNGGFTFKNGSVVERDWLTSVIVITMDADLATQIPFGRGCRSRKFYQVVLNGGDVCIRRPEDLFRIFLGQISTGFLKRVDEEDGVGLSALFLEDISAEWTVWQLLSLFVVLIIGANDYTFSGNHFLVDGDGKALRREALLLAIRAMIGICIQHDKDGRDPDVSIPHLIWVVCTSEVSIGKLDSTAAQRARRKQLGDALCSIVNQKEWAYQMLSRLITMFPRKEERQLILPKVLGFIGLDRLPDLAKVLDPSWLKSARELDFPFKPVEANSTAARKFLMEYFPFQEKKEKPRKPDGAALPLPDGVAPPLPVTWRFAGASGQFGNALEKSIVTKTKRNSKKKKPMTQGSPVESTVQYWNQLNGDVMLVDDVNQKVVNFYKGLSSDKSRRDDVTQLMHRLQSLSDADVKTKCEELGIPVCAPFSERQGSTDVYLLAQAAPVGQNPLVYAGPTGEFVRNLVHQLGLKTLDEMQFVSTDTVLEPLECGVVKCECGSFPFGNDCSWHLYQGNCDTDDCCGIDEVPDSSDGDDSDHDSDDGDNGDDRDNGDNGDDGDGDDELAPGAMDQSSDSVQCLKCAHASACRACRAIRKCVVCGEFNAAVFASAVILQDRIFARNSFAITVTMGNEARNAFLMAKQSLMLRDKALSEEYFKTAHLIHYGATQYDNVAPSLLDNFGNGLWDVFQAVTSCTYQQSPLAPLDQIFHYKFFRKNVVTFRKIPAMERLIGLEKERERGSLPNSKGTGGLLGGKLRASKKKGKKSPKPARCDLTFIGPSTRRLVPFSQCASQSDVAKELFTKQAYPRENWAALLELRYGDLVKVFNKLNVLNKFGHLLRVVGAGDHKLESVAALDQNKCRSFLQLLTMDDNAFKAAVNKAKEDKDSRPLLERFGIAKDLLASFHKLRHVGSQLYESIPKLLRSKSIFGQLFWSPLGHDSTWRIDVPARSQLLGMLRQLLLFYSKGVTNSAVLSIYFIFANDDFETELDALGEAAAAEDKEDADAESKEEDFVSQGFINAGVEGSDDVVANEETKKKLTSNVFSSSVGSALNRIKTCDREAVVTAARALRAAIRAIIPARMLEQKSSAEPEEKRRSTRVAQKVVHQPLEELTVWTRFQLFLERSSFGAQAPGLTSDALSNIASIRAEVYSLLLNEWKKAECAIEHPGFKQSPLPRQAVAMPLQSSMFFTTQKASKTDVAIALQPIREWLVSPPTATECAMLKIDAFKELEKTFVDRISLPMLFPVGGFPNGVMNSIKYTGQGYFSAFCLKQVKRTATRVLKSNESRGRTTALNALYNPPSERDAERQEAVRKAADRQDAKPGNMNGSAKRVPTGKERGFVTADRFMNNMDQLKQEFNNDLKERFNSGQSGRPPDSESDSHDVQFKIRLQSLGKLDKAHSEHVLKWLMDHPLVVLDPGLRWVLSGILARLIKSHVEDDGTVELVFEYRILRISGRKWAQFEESAESDSFLEQKLEATVRGAVEKLSSPEFLKANDKTEFVQRVFTDDTFDDDLKASFDKILSEKAIRRKEARLAHQKKLSLQFVRRIDELCTGKGDPVVIVGAAGGNGGKGRAQVKHQIVLDTLAGFFTVILLDEFCTSKKTPCCHQDAYASKRGRSRGCMHCKDPVKRKPAVWWDRDAGASW